MVTKDIYLRRRLIKTASILTVILLLLGTGGWLLSDSEDNFTQEKADKDGENNKIRAEYDDIKNLLGQQYQINNLYTTYSKSHNTDFSINRETAAALLAKLCVKHHLANATVSISPILPVGNVPFVLKSSQLLSGNITMSFGAVTDNSVYNFIESVETEIPGIILVQELKLARTGSLGRETLTALSTHKILPIVGGEINFLWIGLQSKAEKSKTPGSAR